MSKSIFWPCLFLLIFFSACARQEKAAIKIGDIVFTRDEFEQAFRDSRFAVLDAGGRKEFLEDFISTRLILKEAEEKGLDKNPQFLQDIQNYWGRGLMKLMLAEKTKEMMAEAGVTDAEVRDYYLARRETEFAGKELTQAYDQIKWLLVQQKQRRLMGEWIDSLKSRTRVTVNYDLLGIKK